LAVDEVDVGEVAVEIISSGVRADADCMDNRAVQLCVLTAWHQCAANSLLNSVDVNLESICLRAVCRIGN